MKYTFTYGVTRTDIDAKEVAEEASLSSYPATADGPFLDEGPYEISHEFEASTDEAAIACMRDIIDESPMDIFVFSLSRNGETIRTEEDDEEEED